MNKRMLFLCLLAVMVLLVTVALGGCQGDKGTESSVTDNHSSTETTSGTETVSGTESASGTEAGGATTGGSVVVGMTQDLVSLDPHIQTDAGTRNVVFNLFEGLVKPTSDGDLVPAVASDYEILEDGKVYSFTLREGITFHDGSRVTVENIKYSIERYAEVQAESSVFSAPPEVVLIDESTVEIRLDEANTELLADLATVYIIPRSNTDVATNPIGTGPFKYVSYTAGQKLVLNKYDGYWKEGYPYLDEVTFKFIADVETAFVELQAGTLDILNYLTIDQAELLGDDFNIVEGSMNLVHALYLNNDYEPLQDVKVRQALSYAVDKDTINEFWSGGKSRLIGSHMIPSIAKYYEEGAEGLYPYNVEKAKELLAEAGYTDGFDLVITVPSSYTQHVSTAEVIVEYLKAVGINASIELVEWSTWLSDVYTDRNYQATVIGVDGKLAPSSWLIRYVSSYENNFVNYSNEEYDSIFALAKATVDESEKIELYKELQMILAEDAVNVFIQDPAEFVAVNSKLAGYEVYPVAAQDLSTVYYVEQ